MTIKTQKLLHQIRQAQQLGRSILAMSGLSGLNLVYVFATDSTLVINCRDYPSVWQLDEGHLELRYAMHQLGLSIQTIWIEKEGQLFCEF